MTKLPEGFEKAVYLLINQVTWKARIALETQLVDTKFDIACAFGDTDWMDQVGARKISYQKVNFKLQSIKGAGHQMMVDNSEGVSAFIRAECQKKVTDNVIIQEANGSSKEESQTLEESPSKNQKNLD